MKLPTAEELKQIAEEEEKKRIKAVDADQVRSKAETETTKKECRKPSKPAFSKCEIPCCGLAPTMANMIPLW